jgi:hypothetical protein
MNWQGNNQPGGKRPFFTALLLFVLVAHAFFVSSTHHHSPAQLLSESNSSGSFHSSGETEGAKELSSEASCLSCRLQRNFVFDAQQSVVLEPKPLQKSIRVEVARLESFNSGSCLLLSDRAPPRS